MNKQVLQKLVKLANHLDKSFFHKEAEYIDAIMYKIAELNDKLMAAKDPNTLAETLISLASDDDWKIRHLVSRNPNTPADALSILAKDQSMFIRAYVARHKNTSVEDLIRLSKDSQREVKVLALMNPNIPQELKYKS